MKRGLDWYKRDPRAFLDGVRKARLTDRQAAVYAVVLDLIYDGGGETPNDPGYISAHFSNVGKAAIRKTIAELVEVGKLILEGDMLTQKRAQNEAKTKRNLSETRAETGRKGGINSGKRRRELSENKNLDEASASSKTEAEKRREEKEKVQKEKTGRATRIPSDFPGTDETEWARSKGLSEHQVKREIEKFTEYWGNKTGKGSTKLDWSKTWKVWVNNAIDKGWVVVANANGGMSETERAIREDRERKKKQQEGSAQPEHLFLAAGGMR